MKTHRITKIHALYFSGTGTTQKTVCRLTELLAEHLDVSFEITSFTSPSIREQEFRFTDNELVILGVPVYAGRVPNILLPFLSQKLHADGALSIPVVLYGNRNYDDALIELHCLTSANGFHSVAAAAFIGEHSFSRTLAANRPDEQDMQQLTDFAHRISLKLADWESLAPTPLFVPGNDPIRPYYTPRDRHGNTINILKVKPLTDEALCTQCGLCAQLCPMGSIASQDPSQISGICIKCCACVKKCPNSAKYFADEGYLYHQHELEAQFSRRVEPELFL